MDGDVKRIEKRNASSYPSILDEAYFVSPYERRRLKILNSIFLAMARLEMQSAADGKNPSEFSVRVGNTQVKFRLDDPKATRASWRPGSDVRRPATDPLQLSISWYREKEEGLRLVWIDSLDAPLEESLQEIVIGLIVAGEMQVRAGELQRHTWRVEQKAELIAAVRKREEEARRKERARLQRLEKARIEHLLEDAMSLRLANDLRTYIQAVQEVINASDVPVSDEEMAEWVPWASAQVERIDPIQRRSFLQVVEDPGEVPRDSGSQPRTSNRSDDVATTPTWHPNRWYTQLHR